jgi:protein arginine kinase activator
LFGLRRGKRLRRRAGRRAVVDSLPRGSVLDAIQSGVREVERKSAEAEKPCPTCGITLKEFQKRGRLGCPEDYEVFEDELSRLLRKLHRADVHVGSVPSKAQARRGRRRFIRERIDALKKELDAVVRSERFEEAARLRDRLKELEKAEEDGA